MDFLRSAYDMLPRRLRSSQGPPEQAVLSIKKTASLLCATCSLQTGSGVSELPYYGLSPPVYPSRNVSQPPLSPPVSSFLTGSSPGPEH
jgi:beta-glucosidase